MNTKTKNLYLGLHAVLDRECMGFMSIVYEVIWLQKDEAEIGD